MKKLRWPFLIVILSLVAISVLLLTQKTQLLPTNPISATLKPTSGGVYTEGFIGSPSRFNPVLDRYNPSDHDLDRLIYSGLMRFDDHGLPQGDLAESWGISRDGKVYNFSLRPAAVWHDGQPVTSDDILFTVDMMRSDSSTYSNDVRDMWKLVEVKKLDDKTLQFILPEPFAPFMDYLTFGVLPKHLFQAISSADMVKSTLNLQPVGSGPYRFDHLIVENGQIKGVALKAFKDYFGQKPYIEQFIIRFYSDAASALAAYKNGEINGISRVTQDILADALKEPTLHLYTGRLPQMTLIYFNLGSQDLPFFQDATIRKALLMGLNRQYLIDHLMGSQAILADGPIFPDNWAYYDAGDPAVYDSSGAIALLKAAGYTIPASGGNVRAKKDGPALKFEMLYPDDDVHKGLAEAIQQNWIDLGVGVTIKPVPYDQLFKDNLPNHTYQAALVDLNLSNSPDPDPYPFWHQAQATNGQNYSMWNDRLASEYLEQARVTVDMNERAKLYRNFQVRFAEDLPALPLFYPVYSYGINADIQGVSMGPLFDSSDRFATVTSWFLLAKNTTKETASPAPVTPTTKP